MIDALAAMRFSECSSSRRIASRGVLRCAVNGSVLLCGLMGVRYAAMPPRSMQEFKSCPSTSAVAFGAQRAAAIGRAGRRAAGAASM